MSCNILIIFVTQSIFNQYYCDTCNISVLRKLWSYSNPPQIQPALSTVQCSHNLCSTFFRINCRRLSNGIMQINTTITHNSSPLSALHCTDIKLSRYIKREGGRRGGGPTLNICMFYCFMFYLQ